MDIVLTILAIAVGLVGYAPYFRDIAAGKTKPHAFSWFVWALLTAIAFFAQLSAGGGWGAWVTGVTALISVIITIVAWQRARQNIVRIDWYFLGSALVAIGLWTFTRDPVGAVILVTLTDMLAFIPTFRKSFHAPYDETLFTYVCSAVKFALALLALSTYSVVTVLYPLSLVITNTLFVLWVMARRRVQSAT